ncbi:MAG: hypothetical protein PHS73_03525 [Candidatus Peribacteraceae bacterium]|nr:hypothetical protein [Candidatus Peribacteraceae bacterium]
MTKQEHQLFLPFGSGEPPHGKPPKTEWDDHGALHKHRFFRPMADLVLKRVLRLRDKFGGDMVAVQAELEELQRRRPPKNDTGIPALSPPPEH